MGGSLSLCKPAGGGGCRKGDLELDWCCDETCPGTPKLRAEVDNGPLGVVVASVLKMEGCYK